MRRRGLESLAVAESDRRRVNLHDRTANVDFNAHRLEVRAGVVASRIGELGEQSSCDVHEHDSNLGGIETKTVTSNHDIDQLRERTRSFDSGRTAAHDDERHTHAFAVGRDVGPLECRQESIAKSAGVGQRVERQCELLGAGHREVRRDRAGRHDEVVEGDLRAIVEDDDATRVVNGSYATVTKAHVSSGAEDRANRVGDVSRFEARGRYLVQEWLKGVEVVLVDDRDTNILITQAFGGRNTREPTTDNDDVGHRGKVAVRLGPGGNGHVDFIISVVAPTPVSDGRNVAPSRRRVPRQSSTRRAGCHRRRIAA